MQEDQLYPEEDLKQNNNQDLINKSNNQGQPKEHPQSKEEAVPGGDQEQKHSKKQKYKKTKIRVNLIEEADYQSIKINTIKFVEVNENEEQLNNLKGSDKGGEKLKETELDQLGI